MTQRFSNVVLVKNHARQTEFLKCRLLKPVVCQNPKPAWTNNLDEAEQLTGEKEHLLAIASRFDAIPICHYGTPQKIRLDSS